MLSQNKDQEKYLTVTQILKKYQNYIFCRPEDLDKGSLVHEWCKWYLKGLFIPKPAFLEGYCDSFQRWVDVNIEKTLLCEERLYDKTLELSGKPDWIGIIKNDKVVSVGDWKSCITKNRFWRTQLAAYIYLAKKQFDPQKAFSLRLFSDGKEAKPDFYEPKDMTRDFIGGFLPAFNAHKYFLGGN